MGTSDALWNVLYASVAVGIVVVIAMTSSQYQDSNPSVDTASGRKSALSKLVSRSSESLRSAKGQKDPVKALLLAQDSLSMVTAARMLATDQELEEETETIVKDLTRNARRRVRDVLRVFVKEEEE